MYTKKQWLIIVRNILRRLGYNTTTLGIDAEINRLSTKDAQIVYRKTLQEILHEDDFNYSLAEIDK
ncbi:hypothetical protein Riv7116_3951 [Rivularia sp. PCC 7116]|uniref:hypothetical protein n=1 Tax=Rivularia sp. PCC 7116 TaxID=373994 RepID=UPI00029F1250|nr:hypothetical protein [Rivularia sp. PCC 7116]AFY56391.1 hypothetical protein Riv7116_3951 [Rivularia sp. PCC 7116]